jgi:ABC-type glycerol-3-phosphate transport system permease component
MHGRRVLSGVFAYVVLGLLVVWAVFPLYWLFASSIKPPGDLFAYPPRLVPNSFSLRHFRQILTYTSFPTYFVNSVVVAVLTTGLSVIIAALGGYGLTRHNTPATRFLARIVLFTYMFPRILLIIPLYYMINLIGLIDTRVGLILAYSTFNLPFALWLLRSYFATLPHELDESAMIDGASRLQAFTRVIFPLALPGLATTAIFAFVNAWNEFMYASVFINSDNRKTLPIAIQSMISGELTSWGGLLASATMVTIPTVLFFAFLQKYIVAGLTAGAMKG